MPTSASYVTNSMIGWQVNTQLVTISGFQTSGTDRYMVAMMGAYPSNIPTITFDGYTFTQSVFDSWYNSSGRSYIYTLANPPITSNGIFSCSFGGLESEGGVCLMLFNNVVATGSTKSRYYANGTGVTTSSLVISGTLGSDIVVGGQVYQDLFASNTSSADVVYLGTTHPGAVPWSSIRTAYRPAVSESTDIGWTASANMTQTILAMNLVGGSSFEPVTSSYSIYYRVSDDNFVSPLFNEWSTETSIVNDIQVNISNHLVETHSLVKTMYLRPNGDIVANQFSEI